MSIFDFKGDGHKLSKGAFDSLSISKPGNASPLLAEYMAKPFQEGYRFLSTPYQFNVNQMEAPAMTSLWNDYLKPGLKKAGSIVWEVAKPVAMEVVTTLAGLHPTVGALLGASEAVLSAYLQGYGDVIVESKKIQMKKGQWLFIEKEENRRRRMKTLMTGQSTSGRISHVPKFSIKPQPPHKIPNVVNFGFFVGPGPNDPNKVNVFNLDTGKQEHVAIQQIRDAPDALQKKADEDENLSVLRELYFYKVEGQEFEKAHPKEAIYPGRQVVCDGKDYIVIFRNEEKALIEDPKGNTLVVDVAKLTRGRGKSTKGQTDDFFNKSGGGAYYAGQWCMVPARPWVTERWPTDSELAVIYQVDKNEELEIAYCLDGAMDYIREKKVQVFPPTMQQLYSARQPFKLFKMAAVEGYEHNTQRFELGSKFASICTLDYGKTTMYLGDLDSEEMEKFLTKTSKAVPLKEDTNTKVHNTKKDLVDAVNEAQNKGLDVANLIDEAWDPEQEEYGYEGEGDDSAVLLGVIAVGALVLIGFGGAAA